MFVQKFNKFWGIYVIPKILEWSRFSFATEITFQLKCFRLQSCLIIFNMDLFQKRSFVNYWSNFRSVKMDYNIYIFLNTTKRILLISFRFCLLEIWQSVQIWRFSVFKRNGLLDKGLNYVVSNLLLSSNLKVLFIQAKGMDYLMKVWITLYRWKTSKC
jgi:hypothetical protein